MRTQGIKQIANKMLDDDTRPVGEKRVICELMDAYIAGHKNPVTEGFFYLDLSDSQLSIDAWNAAGKPVITKDNAHKFVFDVYRREYY